MDYDIKKKSGLTTKIKNVSDILNIIPPEVIEQFAVDTNVDRHVKLLQGGLVFNMLIHMLISEGRVSQRAAREILVKRGSAFAFRPKSNRIIADHTSVTHRLEHIKVEFFEKIYEEMRKQVRSLYQPIELHKLHICAVDSTIVAETCNKLEKGFHIGNKRADGSQRKHVKYSEVFDGLNVLGIAFNDDKTKQSENNALPEVIKSAAKQDRLHQNLYVVDRVLAEAAKLEELSGQKEGGDGKDEDKDKDVKVNFLVRISDKRRVEVVETYEIPTSEYRTGDGKIVRIKEFDKVKIFKSATSKPESATYRHVKAEVTDEIANPDGTVSETSPRIVNLLTDVEELSATDMLETYRKRWMIEVFFKFIKQNLDFSHLISTNANGLKVMMYMTMIAAMMVLIYGRLSGMGFASAKSSFNMEIENIMTAEQIVINGADPRKFMKLTGITFPKWIQCGLPPLRQSLRDIISDYENVIHTIAK